MGQIVDSKVDQTGVLFSVKVDYEEATQLKGHVRDVHLFSERAAERKTNLSGRGRNSATKYLLVPRELRKDIRFAQSKKISCQRIDTKDHAIFVYLVNKIPYFKDYPENRNED